MFVVGISEMTLTNTILSIAFDISSAVYSQNFSVAAQETAPRGLAFNTDGTKMFIVGTSGDDVNEYDLSAGFDISSAVYSQNFSVAAQEATPYGLAFNTTALKCLLLGLREMTLTNTTYLQVLMFLALVL
jgi:SpoU rRNA methylase family enzyme